MNETQIFTFIGQHWWLVTLFIVLLVLILSYDQIFGGNAKLNISPQELVNLINHHQAVVIDLRQREAFLQAHIINAINIPIDQFEKNLNKLNEYKDKPIIFIESQTSPLSKIRKTVKEKITSHIKILAGGINAWKDAGLPTQKG